MRRPERRSRNAGKTQGGRVRDGRAREKLSRLSPRSIWQQISESDGPRQHFTENASRDFFHPCTVIECEEVLARLPSELTTGVRAIVLRRPTRKDEAFGIEAWRRHLCVALNAFPRDLTTRWPYPIEDAVRRHYAPWCRAWRISDRDSVLVWTKDELRRYYLYHLLLHEVGHINEPWHYRGRRAEAFAEDFALHWARELGDLPNDAPG